MNLRQIKYFLKTIEHMNITKAATELYVSQQALSEQIQKLEDELGKKLFIRSPRLQLTAAGICFLDKAQAIADIQSELLNELNDLDGLCSGPLTIGIGRTLGLTVLPQLLPSFHDMYPQVKAIVIQGNSFDLMQGLESGAIDLAITSKSRLPADVSSRILFQESFGVVVPYSILKKKFPQNTMQHVKELESNFDIAQLSDIPFLLWNERNHCDIKYLQAHGIKPSIALELNDTETIFRLAMQGMGACICAVKNRKIPDNMYCFPIDQTEMQESIVLAYRKKAYVTNAMRAFITHAETYYVAKYE